VAVQEAVTLVFCATRQDFSRFIPHFAEKRIGGTREKGNYAGSMVDAALFIVEAARQTAKGLPNGPFSSKKAGQFSNTRHNRCRGSFGLTIR
jgi:hypothetical protein